MMQLKARDQIEKMIEWVGQQLVVGDCIMVTSQLIPSLFSFFEKANQPGIIWFSPPNY